VLDLAGRLRREDLLEMAHSTAEPAADALVRSFLASSPCAVAVDRCGQVLALFGVVRDPSCPGLGEAWLVAAPELARHAVSMCRLAPPWMLALRGSFAELHCLAWTGNPAHLAWLRWCGFKPDPFPAPGTGAGTAFIRFRRVLGADRHVQDDDTASALTR
jgi:hypothetical protein